ncbi:MAG: HD domain-containing protein [Rhodospirillales bacterium]|jgi:(p)ppGpp synthase/HD superfamily hydrolase|nr:HD domain-containing protein [Rhodospirillales bacterium]
MALTHKFNEALVMAVELHDGQTRKNTQIPYVSHLLGVCAIVLDCGGDEDEAIAALLHDAVEDQGGAPTLARIRANFGDHVAEIVDGLSDAYGEPKAPWKDRKDAYLAGLGDHGESALLVSAADKLYNARTILKDYRETGEAVWARFNGGRDGTLWYYRTLLDALDGKGPAPLVSELRLVVEEIEALAGECSIASP